jgi:uncharacterized membrane protein
MDVLVKQLAHLVAIGCEAAAVLTLAIGAAAAFGRSLWHWRTYADMAFKKQVWLQFASTLALALEFALAADIANTAVAPSWGEIGQLAAIAAIRTLLNLFLARDIDAFSRPAGPGPAASPTSDKG